MICNQGTQSSGEFTAMVLQAMPNSVIVGSQTAGADGNISRFKLSTEFQTGFTSLGVYYPNGESTQRIGIVPDSLVHPTASGIRQGRDEVLEKALQTAGCLVPMFSVHPRNINVAASEGSASYIVTSNTNWSAVSDAEWCTVISSGYGNGTITAIYAENTTHQVRTASIPVSIAGLPAQTVTITQSKSTTGVEERGASEFRIYPNPTKGAFRIACADNEKNPVEVNILDLTGKMMLEKHYTPGKEYNIDFSFAAKGCYFIILKIDKNISVHKLIMN
jgi:hypothetical protein